jgi:hypothetical protein
MQNAIKLENISNLIASPSSYQRKKSMTYHDEGYWSGSSSRQEAILANCLI